MGDWHYLVKDDIAKLLFVGLFAGLVVQHHVVHILLVGKRIHHEELGGHLL